MKHSLYPQVVSCSVMMFHVFTTCVSFDYVVICEIELHFVIRKVVIPTNCVLPNHPAEHLEIMEKHTVTKLCLL